MSNVGQGDTLGHYERLAATYDQNWAQSSEFLDWMSSEIVSAASITSTDRIADVGAGTGLFARQLADRVRPADPILCVDPSAPMLAQLPDSPKSRAVVASAEQMADWASTGHGAVQAGDLDVIFLKESVHHVPTAERGPTLAGLAELLSPGGRLLVVMLPTTLDYPLFSTALARFTDLQPDPNDIQRHLATAGLTATLSYRDFALEIPRDRYLAMVWDRYMSLLSTFDDDELAAGVAEIEQKHPEDTLRFNDRFAFVLGTKAV